MFVPKFLDVGLPMLPYSQSAADLLFFHFVFGLVKLPLAMASESHMCSFHYFPSPFHNFALLLYYAVVIEPLFNF
jgi:hypothetical protein